MSLKLDLNLLISWLTNCINSNRSFGCHHKQASLHPIKIPFLTLVTSCNPSSIEKLSLDWQMVMKIYSAHMAQTTASLLPTNRTTTIKSLCQHLSISYPAKTQVKGIPQSQQEAAGWWLEAQGRLHCLMFPPFDAEKRSPNITLPLKLKRQQNAWFHNNRDLVTWEYRQK